MKHLFVLTFLVTLTLIAGAIREGTMQARSDGTNVIVQWGSADESNVKGFEVERRSGAAAEFLSIAVVQKKGSNSFYEYIDKSAFKTTGTIYQYRIKIVLNNGNAEYSSIITVTHNVSSVKRTWGSLKAMFR
ncbi:MAG: hypothetical protein HYV29_06935 [Ignavibacteriales bacterium]|nr:hypothetical protein [Ignavibacteriales bacterium]